VPLATILPPLATRHYLLRPFPAGYCLTPTAELPRPNGARSGRVGPLSHYAPNRAIPARKSIRSFPLAAAHPLTVLSWPEALHASGSRRACRMHIGRIACSVVALPDFPEFSQAVRYGVPGTRVCVPFKWPNPPVAANSSGFRQLYSPDISGIPRIYSVSWDSAAPLATTLSGER